MGRPSLTTESTQCRIPCQRFQREHDIPGTSPQLFLLIPEVKNERVACIKEWLEVEVILGVEIATQGRARNAC
jgi:hypothetical protein